MSRAALFLLPSLIFNGFAEEAPPQPLVDSFERGVPQNIVAKGGRLSLTTDKLIDGKQGLRWDFKNGDSFVIQTGPLGNVSQSVGYGGYSRSAAVLPLYLPAQGKGKLLIEFRAGEKTAATIEVPFAHVGWQKLAYHYSWSSKMKWIDGSLRGKLDNIRISASEMERPTYAIFDGLRYNTAIDFREGRLAITEAWLPKKHDFSREAAPTKEQLAAVEKLAQSLTPAPNTKAQKSQWESQLKNIRKTIEEKGYSKGHPVDQGLDSYFGFLSSIANNWASCPDTELRAQFATEFLRVNDFLQEQGLVVNGAVGKSSNYGGRSYADAVCRMRAPLAEHGTLDRSVAYLKWSYGYDEQVFGGDYLQSMDYFHNDASRLLQIALSERDPVTRWHHVNAFRHTLSKQLVASIKPDGSIYHHGFHYFAYGYMGMSSISGVLASLSNAGLPASEEALDAAKLALMRMRWYAGGDVIMVSLRGRHTGVEQAIPSGAFAALARAYAPYRGGKPDEELVKAYLRLSPASAKEFPDAQAEAAPVGFVSMPYAGLGLHRGDTWFAGVKGYSKYLVSGESYANANRFGLYLANGMLDLQTQPHDLPNPIGSGTRIDQGWNWLAPDGTTTIHSTLDRIANGNGTRMPTSENTFVGALSHDQRNGLYVLSLTDNGQAAVNREKGEKGGPFRALKSWFFFDNRIVCLGSDISVDNVPFPVRTNLFQKFVDEAHPFVIADGDNLTLGKEPLVLKYDKGGRNTFLDPYDNAYFTAEGDAVELTIAEQKSRDSYDKKDTTGHYATAWIEHGLNPQNAGYEYAVLVRPAQGEAGKFAAALASNSRPYTVLKKDAQAHIVRDAASQSIGHVIFDAKVDLSSVETPLVSTSLPALVMIETRGDAMVVSVTNPDLRPAAKEPQVLEIKLKGALTSERAEEKKMLSSDGKLTTLTVPVLHGESYTFTLRSKKGGE